MARNAAAVSEPPRMHFDVEEEIVTSASSPTTAFGASAGAAGANFSTFYSPNGAPFGGNTTRLLAMTPPLSTAHSMRPSPAAKRERG